MTCGRRLTLGTVLFLLPGFPSAIVLEFVAEGTGNGPYALRRGEVEGTPDNVLPRWGQPACFKMGTRIGVRDISNTEAWKITRAVLMSKVTGTVYWSEGPCPVFHGPGDTHWFKHDAPAYLPAFVEWSILQGDVLEANETSFGIRSSSTVPSYYGFVSDVFTVLEQPKVPMNPAWVSVLEVRCVWARQSSTADRAAELLTQNLWVQGVYDPYAELPNTYFYTTNMTDGGETFHLKSFLTPRGAYRGQCSDFADFLTCLVTSLGAYDMKAQRTYSFGVVYWGGYDPDGWNLLTKLVDPAGLHPPAEYQFTFHQFAVVGTNVWDGAITFIQDFHTALAMGWARDTTYKTALVKAFAQYVNHQWVLSVLPGPGDPWNPTPSSGFAPGVTTISPPPPPP